MRLIADTHDFPRTSAQSTRQNNARLRRRRRAFGATKSLCAAPRRASPSVTKRRRFAPSRPSRHTHGASRRVSSGPWRRVALRAARVLRADAAAARLAGRLDAGVAAVPPAAAAPSTRLPQRPCLLPSSFVERSPLPSTSESKSPQLLLLFHTVVSDDFETITCFSGPVSACGLGIAPPRYRLHRKDRARVSSGRFCEI